MERNRMSKRTAASRALAAAIAAMMLLAAVAGCGSKPGGASNAADGSTPAAQTENKAADAGADAGAADAGGADQGAVADQGATSGINVSLKVWGPQEEQVLLKQMCEAFAAEHPEDTYTFEYGVVGESDGRSIYSEDPAAAADVFMIVNDHLRELAEAQSLYEVTRNKNDIMGRNLLSSVEAATYNGALYAYPMTADNGYFLYYDKSVVSEKDAGSLETLLAAADAAGKGVLMDIANGWYIASFFLGAGCSLGIDAEGRQTCDFNNADGLVAAEGIKMFTSHPAFRPGDDNVLKGGMGSSICAGVTGTWNAAAIQEALGENYAATKLPTFTVGDRVVQMGSFGGFKLVGVNSLTNFPEQAMDLADWLTNEENQKTRFEVREYGPSNKNVAESDAVKANIALSALALQNQFAVPQNDVLGNYWTPAGAFGAAMEQQDTSKPLQDMLNTMVAQIVAQ